MSDNTNTSPSTVQAEAPPKRRPPVHRRGKGKSLHQTPELPPVPRMLTLAEAADVLRLRPEALRARCRRAARKDASGNVTAPLAPGIVGVKMGANTWRVRFDAK